MTALRSWALCSASGSGAKVVAIAIWHPPDTFPAYAERLLNGCLLTIRVHAAAADGYERLGGDVAEPSIDCLSSGPRGSRSYLLSPTACTFTGKKLSAY